MRGSTVQAIGGSSEWAIGEVPVNWAYLTLLKKMGQQGRI